MNHHTSVVAVEHKSQIIHYDYALWQVQCSCGWRSRPLTATAAADALSNHLSNYPKEPTMTAPAERKSVTISLPTALSDRLDAEADTRMLGKSLLVEKALGTFLDTLPAVNLHTPPAGVGG